MSWWNPFDWWSKTITNIWQGLQNAPNLIVNSVSGAVQNIFGPVVGVFQQAATTIQNWIGGIQKAIGGFVSDIAKAITGFGAMIAGAFQSFIGAVLGGFQWFWSELTNKLGSAWNTFLDTINGIMNTIGQAFTGFFEFITKPINDLIGKVSSVFSFLSFETWRSLIDIAIYNLPSISAIYTLGMLMRRADKLLTSPRGILSFILAPLGAYIATQLTMGISGIRPSPPSSIYEYKQRLSQPYTVITDKRISARIRRRTRVVLLKEFETPIQSVGQARLSGFEMKAPAIEYTVSLVSYSGTYTRGGVVATSALINTTPTALMTSTTYVTPSATVSTSPSALLQSGQYITASATVSASPSSELQTAQYVPTSATISTTAESSIAVTQPLSVGPLTISPGITYLLKGSGPTQAITSYGYSGIE